MNYVTTIEANTYFSTRYPNVEWVNCDVDTQTRLLTTAEQLIDQLNFTGEKTDPEQIAEFPRYESLLIPLAIKNACYEIAYALLDGANVEYNSRNINVTSSDFGTVSNTKSINDTPLHLIHNIPSSRAWNYLKPYLQFSTLIRMERMS